MTADRKNPEPQNRQNQQTQTDRAEPRRGEVEDPLKKGMHAAGGHILRGRGMSPRAQQSGRGLGESSLGRNWDTGGEPGQDDRGTISTGPDTAPEERARQHRFHDEQERKQQRQDAGGAQQGTQAPLDETTPPDMLARNPDVTK